MKRPLVFFAVFILTLALFITAFSLQPDSQHQKNKKIVQHFDEETASKGHRQKDIVPTTITTSREKPEKIVNNDQFWYHNQVLVLMYHHISDEPNMRYAISPQLFMEHMQFLAENNLQPISLHEFLEFVDTGELSKQNAVLITFDDGYESYYTEAFPILERFQFPSVNFVISGRLRDVPERERANMIPPLTFSQMRELVSSDLVEVSSHTYSLHEQLVIEETGEVRTATSPLYFEDMHLLEEESEYRDRLFVDFKISRVALEEIVGKKITSLSLPFGFTNEIVRETIRQAGYQYAFTSEPSVVKAGVDPYQIPRFNVGVPEMDIARLAAIFSAARTKA